jgi:hypothetical protein
MPLASIENPEAKTVISAMKSAMKNGQRRFSDKTIVSYFAVLRKVIASVLDEKFNPVHQRAWNLAAIGLPRVNPKKQRRPTLTPQEMATLLCKERVSTLCCTSSVLLRGCTSRKSSPLKWIPLRMPPAMLSPRTVAASSIAVCDLGAICSGHSPTLALNPSRRVATASSSPQVGLDDTPCPPVRVRQA